MKRYLPRIVIAAAATAVLLVAARQAAGWWFGRGPGFRHESARLAAVGDIRAGMTVADVGAGTGRMTALVAARVGASGRLFATEISEGLLQDIRQRAADAGLNNITPVLAGERTTGLAAGCCDVIYMRRVYHHLTDAPSIAAGLYASLRPGGRLVVIEMMTPWWLPVTRHGLPAEVVRSGFERAGFRFVRHIGWWSPIDYCLVFRKADRSD